MSVPASPGQAVPSCPGQGGLGEGEGGEVPSHINRSNSESQRDDSLSPDGISQAADFFFFFFFYYYLLN